jgi:hypothetical protein
MGDLRNLEQVFNNLDRQRSQAMSASGGNLIQIRPGPSVGALSSWSKSTSLTMGLASRKISAYL